MRCGRPGTLLLARRSWQAPSLTAAAAGLGAAGWWLRRWRDGWSGRRRHGHGRRDRDGECRRREREDGQWRKVDRVGREAEYPRSDDPDDAADETHAGTTPRRPNRIRAPERSLRGDAVRAGLLRRPRRVPGRKRRRDQAGLPRPRSSPSPGRRDRARDRKLLRRGRCLRGSVAPEAAEPLRPHRAHRPPPPGCAAGTCGTAGRAAARVVRGRARRIEAGRVRGADRLCRLRRQRHPARRRRRGMRCLPRLGPSEQGDRVDDSPPARVQRSAPTAAGRATRLRLPASTVAATARRHPCARSACAFPAASATAT